MKFHTFRSKRKSLNNEVASSEPDIQEKDTELTLKIIRECQVCCCEKKNSFFISTCHHEACLDCWREYLSTKVENFQMANMSCIACSERLTYEDISCIFRGKDLNDNDERFSQNFDRYDKFLLDQYLIHSKQIHWCPYGCGFGILVENTKLCPVFSCRICQEKAFCTKCSEPVTDVISHRCHNNLNELRNISPAQNIISNLANFFQQITGAHLPLNQFRRRSSQTNRTRNNDVDGTSSGLSNQKNFTSMISSASSSGSINDFYQSCASSFSSVNSMVMPTPSIAHPYKINSKKQTSIAIQTLENEERTNTKSKKKPRKFPAFSLLERNENQPFIGDKSENELVSSHIQNLDSSEKKYLDEKSTEDKSFGKRDNLNFHAQNPFKGERPESCPGQMKQCPRCRTWVLKLNDGTCNHMYCGVCNCEFCWLCLREINSMHYLGPSGCTFWGREQWSVRKRILLVVGLAIGAPTFLAILTAIALPCIFFGFPVMIGRKVFRGFTGKPKHLRVWWTTFAILLSIITAPLVAVLATTIGLIASIIFIYIYMPIASFTSYVSAKKNQELQISQNESDDSNFPSSSEEYLRKKPLPSTIEWDPNILNSEKNIENEIEWDRLAQSSKASKFTLIFTDDKCDSLEESDKLEVM